MVQQQPLQHPFRMTFEPVAYPGDFVQLINPGAGASDVVGRVLGVLPLPDLQVDFGAPTNGNAVGPYAFTASAAGVGADQLVVGAYEFGQARIYLEPRDFAALQPGADAYLQLYAQGSSQLMWGTQNGQFVWRPLTQNRYPDLAPTEFFWWYNNTPQAKVTNNTGNTLNNTRVEVGGFHYWYIDRTLDYHAAVGSSQRSNIDLEIARSISGHIIPITLGPLGSSSVPGATPR